MKKIIAIMMSVITIGVLFSSCAINTKATLTPEIFTQEIQNNHSDFTVEDKTSDFDDENLTNVTVAYNDSFQIEFYTVKSDLIGLSTFYSAKRDLNSKYGKQKVTSKNDNGKNSASAYSDVDDKYEYICQKGNTVVKYSTTSYDRALGVSICELIGY